jgi:hypothetical protein
MLNRLAIVVLSVSGVVLPLRAQQPDSGTVSVEVREAMGMVDGILVRSGTRSATTDANGMARLVFPSGAGSSR